MFTFSFFRAECSKVSYEVSDLDDIRYCIACYEADKIIYKDAKYQKHGHGATVSVYEDDWRDDEIDKKTEEELQQICFSLPNLTSLLLFLQQQQQRPQQHHLSLDSLPVSPANLSGKGKSILSQASKTPNSQVSSSQSSSAFELLASCLLYTSPSPRDVEESRMPSSA